MIDTAALYNRYHAISEKKIKALGAKFKPGKIPTWVLNPPRGSELPRITIEKLINPKNVIQIKAEASLPRIIHGHNQLLLSEEGIQKALSRMCEYVEEKIYRSFSMESAVVCRADFARDYRTNSEVHAIEIVRRLESIRLTRMTTSLVGGSSVYFEPRAIRKDRQIIVYSKYAEVHAKSSSRVRVVCPGTIRFEIRFLSKDRLISAIKKIGIAGDANVRALNQEVADRLFAELFTSLQFPSTAELTSKSILESVLGKFSGRKAMEMTGLAYAASLYGEDIAFDLFGLSASKRSRMRKMLKESRLDIKKLILE